MCIEERVPIAPQLDVAAAVISVASDTTLPSLAVSWDPVYLTLKVLDDYYCRTATTMR